MESYPVLSNGGNIALEQIPQVTIKEFRDHIISEIWKGGRILALFGRPSLDEMIRLFAVLGYDTRSGITVLACDVKDSYPSITTECAQAHWFEREIAEQWGVIPQKHPWLKPIRFHQSYRHGYDAWKRTADAPILPSVTDFFKVDGEEIHEVAVGPVHAGVIEPGHFRFQCHGEKVFHLEISLGYQHRGVEPRLIGGPDKKTIHYMETLAGDTSIGHALAYCHAIESLSGVSSIPDRANVIRGIALELERLANHTGDLGALANDVGYLPTASYCGRLRGDFLNMSALICGSRLGRGLVRPGGVMFDIDEQRRVQFLERLERTMKDVNSAVELLWAIPSVLARFENTGTVSHNTARELGLVGPAARASGTERDIRRDFPYGIYKSVQIPVATCLSGDVYARAMVRSIEIKNSIAFIQDRLKNLPGEGINIQAGDLAPNRLCVSLVEGWRGEICHVAITDQNRRFSGYKIIDPSFHNWIGLAMALRSQQISDFPLCNKSFNLSYCGHDL